MHEDTGKDAVAVVNGLSRTEMEALREALNTFRFLQNFLNDQVVRDLSKNLLPLMKLFNAAVSTDLIDLAEKALQDPELDKTLLNPPEVGVFGLLRTLGDANARKGLGIVLGLLKAMGRATSQQ
jgi:uncharacterized protein YjgD (DUF1641 family)